MNKLLLSELVEKYYPQLNEMMNYLAHKGIGGEEAKVVFPAGSVTIKLK